MRPAAAVMAEALAPLTEAGVGSTVAPVGRGRPHSPRVAAEVLNWSSWRRRVRTSFLRAAYKGEREVVAVRAGVGVVVGLIMGVAEASSGE